MAQELLAPLNWLIGTVEKLLAEETFNAKQRMYLLYIAQAASALQTLVLTFTEIDTEASRQMLSYEGRSHLATVIGYAEELLDEIDGPLNDAQRDLLFEVRSSAQQVLNKLETFLE